MDGVSLIIRADDFGLYHAANQAIEEGFETGILTSATLAGAGPWLSEAVSFLQDHPTWEVGLELQLHCTPSGCAWGPVAGRVLVPSLVTITGDFPPMVSEHATLADLRREMDAQLNRVLQHGIRPAFLECAAESTLIDQALGELSGAYGIPARMTTHGLSPLNPSDAADPFDPSRALRSLKAGAYLWVVRPAQDTPETWAIWSADPRHQADARAICDPELSSLLVRQRIRQITFQQYLSESKA
jgi:predicted glycoside hydrolase/deacetylase ChbG (UPF0249 family)